MPRTTLDLDATVLRELKRRQKQERRKRPLGQIASELLAQALAETKPEEPKPFKWSSQNMGPPLVDLEDKDALWAVLDER